MPEAARRLWALALQANQAEDDFFPIWATCMGYEYLLMLVSDEGVDILQSGFDAENVSLPLNLNDKGGSVLYKDARIRVLV